MDNLTAVAQLKITIEDKTRELDTLIYSLGVLENGYKTDLKAMEDFRASVETSYAQKNLVTK